MAITPHQTSTSLSLLIKKKRGEYGSPTMRQNSVGVNGQEVALRQ